LPRFLADENVSRLVVERLRERGFKIMTIADFQPGMPDRDVLTAAEANGLVLITEDQDFGEMVVRQKLRVLGVVLLELDRLSNTAEADRVLEVLSGNVARLSGNLVVLEPGRVRIRPLTFE
jgi:predicted nuclease of predicted toxin-antitoxin system